MKELINKIISETTKQENEVLVKLNNLLTKIKVVNGDMNKIKEHDLQSEWAVSEAIEVIKTEMLNRETLATYLKELLQIIN